MKRLLAIVVVNVGMLAGQPSALAQILVDAFLDNTIAVTAPGAPSSVITNDIDASNIDRQISVEASGALSIVSTVDAGFLIVDAAGSGAGSASAEMEYLGFVMDLSNNTYFEFSTSKVEGTAFFGLILEDATFGQISGGIFLTPTDTGLSYFLDITQFAGYTAGFGSQLNSIQVLIDGTDDYFVQGDSFQFSTVPEPASGLLFGTGLCGLAFRRRRVR